MIVLGTNKHKGFNIESIERDESSWQSTRVSHYASFGGGEMGERIRAFDWSKTPIGSTRNMVTPCCGGIVLRHRYVLNGE
jgi:hypothetical protein